MDEILNLSGVSKTFTMHLQGGIRLPVVNGVAFSVHPGECVVLAGPSGTGKSSILKMIFGSYRCDEGHIRLHYDGRATDIATAGPREILALRKKAVGYVSQFLRAVPHVPTIDIVAGPLEADGVAPETAGARAGEMLSRLNLSERLWQLPPATFSGGEQQRVNIARGFIRDYPILLLDEPTASLDGENRNTVVDMILEAKKRGAAVVGIFHDDDVRGRVADRCLLLNRPE